eukprot:1148689-Pelagomonas_calceolata.AAC.1
MGWQMESPHIWVRGNCVVYQKYCHGFQSSSSIGIECYSPRERLFSLEWRVPILGGLSEYEVEASLRRILRARSPISSDAKLASGGQMLLCRPSALALWSALQRTSKQWRGHRPDAFAVRIDKGRWDSSRGRMGCGIWCSLIGGWLGVVFNKIGKVSSSQLRECSHGLHSFFLRLTSIHSSPDLSSSNSLHFPPVHPHCCAAREGSNRGATTWLPPDHLANLARIIASYTRLYPGNQLEVSEKSSTSINSFAAGFSVELSLGTLVSKALVRLPIEHRAQPPPCYGALVKREEGDSQEEGSGSNPGGRGRDKDALYGWESKGGSFLNARDRTASVDLSLPFDFQETVN